MTPLLCLLFHDALSDHTSLFLCMSMYLETDLPTQEDNHKNHQRNASPWVSSLVDPSLVHSRAWLAVGELGTWNLFLRDFFFWIFFSFFGGLVLADWPPPLP